MNGEKTVQVGVGVKPLPQLYNIRCNLKIFWQIFFELKINIPTD